jgi:hypothetical protein
MQEKSKAKATCYVVPPTYQTRNGKITVTEMIAVIQPGFV